MDRTPFTILDADFFLYLVNGSDEPLSEVYMGGCAESVKFGESFTARRLEYHGLRHAREYHEDEEHSIELKNLWLHEVKAGSVAGGRVLTDGGGTLTTDGGDRLDFDVPGGGGTTGLSARMPRGHERNRRYCMVVLWQDAEYGVWTKRTYYGVTSHGQQLEETMQTLPFRAERMTELAGLIADGLPTGAPAILGSVRYFDTDGSSLDLYVYNSDDAVLTAIDGSLLAGRAEITVDAGAGTAAIEFDGVRALWANDTRTEVRSVAALGGTILDELPRLEFLLNGARVAALGGDGRLAVPNLREGADPGLPDFELRAGGVRLFSFYGPRCYTPEVVEVAGTPGASVDGSLTTDDGDTLTTDDGDRITTG